jgi:hypothetical protein
MAITIYEYAPIYISAGFKLHCKIDSKADIVLVQELFVDLCCRCLDLGDLLLGYDEENNLVDTGINYPINEPFTMIFDNIDKRLMVLRLNEDSEQAKKFFSDLEDL